MIGQFAVAESKGETEESGGPRDRRRRSGLRLASMIRTWRVSGGSSVLAERESTGLWNSPRSSLTEARVRRVVCNPPFMGAKNHVATLGAVPGISCRTWVGRGRGEAPTFAAYFFLRAEGCWCRRDSRIPGDQHDRSRGHSGSWA